jgi:putative transposase
MRKARFKETEIVRVLKELKDENRRLKQMYADLSLKHEALKDIVEKKL